MVTPCHGPAVDGAFRTLEVHRHDQPAGTSTRIEPFPMGAAGGPTLRPQLTDDGRVLARLSNGAIALFDAAGKQTTFASGADGFATTGAAPGGDPGPRPGRRRRLSGPSPQQVVNVDFFPDIGIGIYPSPSLSGGATAANLALLQEVRLGAGWAGSFFDAMTSVE